MDLWDTTQDAANHTKYYCHLRVVEGIPFVILNWLMALVSSLAEKRKEIMPVIEVDITQPQ